VFTEVAEPGLLSGWYSGLWFLVFASESALSPLTGHTTPAEGPAVCGADIEVDQGEGCAPAILRDIFGQYDDDRRSWRKHPGHLPYRALSLKAITLMSRFLRFSSAKIHLPSMQLLRTL